MTVLLQPALVGPGLEAGTGESAGRIALVAVAGIDRRAASAVAFALTIQPDTLLAVHVAVDNGAARRLRTTWTRSSWRAVPLQVIDDIGGVAATIRSLTSQFLLDGADDVTVVAGRLAMPGIARVVLHDRTADAIARGLAALVGARVALVPVATNRR